MNDEERMKKNLAQKTIKPLLIVFLLVSIWAPAAKAAMVGTQAMSISQTQGLKAELQASLGRDEIRNELVSMGVDPLYADARIASLTDEELYQLQGRLKDLPAGSGALEVIGVVFLVLLILELVGITNVFSKI